MSFDRLTFVPSSPTGPGASDDRFGERAFAEALQKVAADTPLRAALRRLVAQVLVATPSHDVRDAAALALVDLDARGEIDALVRVIGRPELAQHNGTLIFALDELGGSIPLPIAVQIVAQGSYEATAETLLIVQDGRVEMPDDPMDRERSQQTLLHLQKSDNPDISEAATTVLATLF